MRLALARYQPNSLPGVELSRVVLTDFLQVAPRPARRPGHHRTGQRTVTVTGRADGNFVTWSGAVSVPPSDRPLRLVVEEL